MNSDIPNFDSFFANKEIVKIYKGKDDHCRCGCGGKYHYSPSKRLLNNAKCALSDLHWYGDEAHRRRFFMSAASTNHEGYMNIPIYKEDNPRFNQCYCIYFKNK